WPAKATSWRPCRPPASTCSTCTARGRPRPTGCSCRARPSHRRRTRSGSPVMCCDAGSPRPRSAAAAGPPRRPPDKPPGAQQRVPRQSPTSREKRSTRMNKQGRLARIAGLVAAISGIVFVIAGGVTWAMVTSQLKAENITVPEDAAFLAGAKVQGPFSAYAQADIIHTHALAGTEGRTYAELGAAMREVEPGSPEHTELQEQRTSVMNASFLRASLFTSVVSYGVAALVIGLGVLLVLIGAGMRQLARVPAGDA